MQECAAQQQLDYAAISACANGTASAKLLKAAQKTVTAACGKEATLPTVRVAGKNVCESDKCTYSVVANAIADAASVSAGADADAVLRPTLRGSGAVNATAAGSAPTITYFFARIWLRPFRWRTLLRGPPSRDRIKIQEIRICSILMKKS